MMATWQDRTQVRYKLGAVINLSSVDLTEDETRVLSRGFKFRPTLRELPIQEIIIGTEALIKSAKVEPDIAIRLRGKVSKEIDRMLALEKRRPTKQNITKKEWVAVHRLKQDQERIIIPADKGDKSIVMNYTGSDKTQEHEEDASVILEYQSYLDKLEDRIQHHGKVEDPAKKHEKALNSALMKMWKVGRQIPIEERQEIHNNQLLLSRASLKDYMTQGAISPRLKGQLKDHKDEKPLREVSDASKSPGHKLAKVLNKLFESYTGQTKTAVKSGKQLVQFIREGRFDGNFLASCDAVALFPSVIVAEALDLLKIKIQQDDSLQQKNRFDKRRDIQSIKIMHRGSIL